MLELHIDSDCSSGYLKVSWCVEQSLLKKLNELGIKNPNIVLIVADPPIERKETDPSKEDDCWSNSSSSETVHCVPFKDLMAYIPLYQAGQKQIIAFIDEFFNSLNATKNRWGNGFYKLGRRNFNSCRDGLIKNSYPYSPKFSSCPVMINIPQDIFASKISGLEKSWLEFMLPLNFKNECELRKYRLFGYTIQIPIYLFWLIPRLLMVVVGFLSGTRGMSAKHLFSPSINMEDFVKEVFPGKGSIFIRDTKSKLIKYFCLFSMPLILLPALIMIFALIKIVLTLGIMRCLFVFGFATLIGSLIIYIYKLFWSWRNQKNNTTPDKPWYLDEEYQKLLICDGQPKPIPAKYRSVRLMVAEIKTKVCKPFAM